MSDEDQKLVSDISEAVYRERLGPDDTRRMIEKDGDNGEKLRSRSRSYDALTRCYLRVLKERGDAVAIITRARP